MDNESEQLEKYIKATVTSIKNAIQGTGFEIVKPIEFDLAVINTSEGGGGFKIYIAKAEGKFKSEEISHIKFEVKPETKIIPQFRNIDHNKNSAR